MLVYLYCDATATASDLVPPPVLRCYHYWHWWIRYRYLCCDATATATDSLQPPVLWCYRKRYWFATATYVAMLLMLLCHHYCRHCCNVTSRIAIIDAPAATVTIVKPPPLLPTLLIRWCGYCIPWVCVLCDVYRYCCMVLCGLGVLLVCCDASEYLVVIWMAKQRHSVFPTEDERDRKWLSIFIWPR